ncbi:MAG: hypothetical protein ACYTGL_05695 [Planctomycetota bacterium]|jgi:hypothetical protein
MSESESANRDDDGIFRIGSEANHDALESLAEILKDAGFTVRKKSPKESTLRVYVTKPNSYPLLNPRFVDGRLEITVLSKGEDESIDCILASLSSLDSCGFESMNETTGDYRYHGIITVPIARAASVSFSDLAVPLSAIHGLLSRRA